MLSTDYVVYVDHAGDEFQAHLIALTADNTAELMVYGGPNGAWTVVNVPHADTPERPVPGAYWMGQAPELDAPVPAQEPTPDDGVANDSAPVEQKPKEKRATRAARK